MEISNSHREFILLLYMKFIISVLVSLFPRRMCKKEIIGRKAKM